ncbi:hypothetical protein PLESTM_000862800 [Pleodorina starrii]|nr:hypothetical protein PLESTM_000862800 [Pleodorina starrii]
MNSRNCSFRRAQRDLHFALTENLQLVSFAPTSVPSCVSLVCATTPQFKRGAMEVAVSSTLSHPNIVQVYASFSGVVVVRCHYKDNPAPVLRLCTADDPMIAGSDPGPLNQVLCLEYCDAGTLLAVARAGAFRQRCASGAADGAVWPALVPLYTSLLEVALALRHLHSRRLVHCDIKPANVLLKSSTRDPRGWSCKLSDFGCVRLMNEVGLDGRMGFRVKSPLGTAAYMAPECFVRGMLLGPEVDIYAFGVLMWELLMCKTPYSNISPQEVPRQVLRSNLRPVFHPLAPVPYCSLAVRCWSGSPRLRPTAVDLVSLLQQLLAEAQTELRPTAATTEQPPLPSQHARPGLSPNAAMGCLASTPALPAAVPPPHGDSGGGGGTAAAATAAITAAAEPRPRVHPESPFRAMTAISPRPAG